MVVFGRKGEDSRPVISAPIAQSSLILDQLSIEQGASAVSLRPGWDTIPPRPKTSEGPPQYQLALGQDYLAPPTPRKHKKLSHSLSKLNLSPMTSLLSSGIPESNKNVQAFSDEVPAYQQQEGAQSPYDIICAKFNTIVTLIDGERFSGDGADLASPQDLPLWQQQESAYIAQEVAKGRSKEVKNKTKSTLDFSSGNYFSKVYLYANSKLPRHLPPMKLYLPTFPLLCLAAQYSERVYEKPSGQEKETLVGADWKTGTKAMVVKSVPMDDMNTIVFAIRGTQTFMDWVANFNATPSPPEGFLDDVENLCHTGFLTVARKMINPVAARLRQLIEESPDRSTYSLLITGHSAGGAVASLLYSHMLSTSKSAASELNILTGCFKRIHCVTYGTPPISIFPLTKPDNPALKKSLFYSFLNEGDPITRAHPTYLRSLIELYTHPAPKITYAEPSSSRKHKHTLTSLPSKSSSTLSIDKNRPKDKKSHTAPVPGIAPVWNVPDLIYSNAGRLILLRGMEKKGAEPSKKKKNIEDRMDEGVVAQVITDEQLRDVIWGDPVMHMMKLYSRRIEVLATNAVTGRGG